MVTNKAIMTYLTTEMDIGNSASDLASDKSTATTGRFVVEQDTVTGIHVIRFTVVDNDPVTVQLGNTVGRTRIERSGLLLGSLYDLTVKLRGRSLVEADAISETAGTDSIEQTKGTQSIHITSVL
jgi:hypothetical protein